jgi:hypothetical protein
VGGVQVLDDDHLVAGGAALARGDGGPGEEQLPDAEPALAVLGVDQVGVAEPVAVPAPERAGVVDADGVDAVWGKKECSLVNLYKRGRGGERGRIVTRLEREGRGWIIYLLISHPALSRHPT